MPVIPAKSVKPSKPPPSLAARLRAMREALERHGYSVVAKGHHHEGPLHPELVHGDGAAHVISVDGEHIAGPFPR